MGVLVVDFLQLPTVNNACQWRNFCTWSLTFKLRFKFYCCFIILTFLFFALDCCNVRPVLLIVCEAIKVMICCLTLYGHIKTAQQWTIIEQYGDWYTGRWWAGLHLVQRGGAWASCGLAQSPPRCTKCNSPPINGQCTNFILFDVAIYCYYSARKLILILPYHGNCH